MPSFALAMMLATLATAEPAAPPAPPPATAAAPTPARTTPEILSAIDAQLTADAAKGFGGALIIQQGDKVLLAKGYGYANREARIAYTPDTVGQIASVTKSQTAAAIATLIAEGRVSLDDPVSKFVPEAPEPGGSRTVAQLLAHTSGLADTCTDDFVRQSEAFLVRTCLARPLAHPVGEDHYSNMGYSLLGLIVQRVTGQSWEDALRARVWKPLSMRQIGVQFPGQSDRTFARGYKAGQPQPLISRSIAALQGDDWALRGNGALQASPRTMIRFLDGILDPKGHFPPAARQMLLAPLPGQTGRVRAGFGFALRYDAAGKLVRIGHSGSDGVFFTYLCWLPQNDVRFYIVGNNGEDEIQRELEVALRGAMRLPPVR